ALDKPMQVARALRGDRAAGCGGVAAWWRCQWAAEEARIVPPRARTVAAGMHLNACLPCARRCWRRAGFRYIVPPSHSIYRNDRSA
ncbi:hypothetical protein, partial [Stenotrophomonas sp. HMWF003]|uniref:hypothetical protein n=1 Tax=Stenotrophomonas sp. HMWF003 TaxID=2056840 RepID=UPI001C62D188